jgi:hypothetical protein
MQPVTSVVLADPMETYDAHQQSVVGKHEQSCGQQNVGPAGAYDAVLGECRFPMTSWVSPFLHPTLLDATPPPPLWLWPRFHIQRRAADTIDSFFSIYHNILCIQH